MRKIDKLERKYEKLFEPWDKKREELVNGLREPEESELGLLKELEAPIESAKSTDIDVEGMKGKKGFPGFWAKAMKNNPVITTYLKDFDMPILESVTDIRSEKTENNSYRIIFKFAPNEYFANTELVKTMVMDKIDDQICKETIGTEIEWKEGKNVTVKVTKKKQKNKKTKVVREVTKSEDVESFFNFFKSRSAPDADEEDEKLIEEIENDMDIAEEIADALIPQALLYYMDLAVDYGHGEDADKVDSEDSEEETSHKPKAKKSKAETKKECKQ
eukprot:TRINITY_DN3580_c0_g1_i15.p1 TRINITY_DN3580_c0_g1~~TRINITY_DN3580_c0_g1_i15.p1  ORF type:complete len:274 (+),score=112.40 TRINITY_DN3580_c0_g1_i15:433-1254(+)